LLETLDKGRVKGCFEESSDACKATCQFYIHRAIDIKASDCQGS